ncbi:hypothetical protein ACFLV8_02355 [Chloroflexota bacterium]
MKFVIKIGIFVLALLIMVVPVVACGEPTSPSGRKIILDDASVVLDMSLELPESFERLDAVSEGLSNKDLGLGSDFSEVELFLSEEPYQAVFAYLTIMESQIERASTDTLIRDEEQIKAMVLENLRAGAAEEGSELSDVDVEVTYPSIGNLAALGSGTIGAYGVSMGYDILIFKSNKVYVSVFSMYLPGESVSLVPLTKGIERRIGMLSQ